MTADEAGTATVVSPGDVVVFQAPGPLAQEEAQKVRDIIAPRFGSIPFVVVPGDWKVSVFREEGES